MNTQTVDSTIRRAAPGLPEVAADCTEKTAQEICTYLKQHTAHLSELVAGGSLDEFAHKLVEFGVFQNKVIELMNDPSVETSARDNLDAAVEQSVSVAERLLIKAIRGSRIEGNAPIAATRRRSPKHRVAVGKRAARQ